MSDHADTGNAAALTDAEVRLLTPIYEALPAEMFRTLEDGVEHILAARLAASALAADAALRARIEDHADAFTRGRIAENDHWLALIDRGDFTAATHVRDLMRARRDELAGGES